MKWLLTIPVLFCGLNSVSQLRTGVTGMPDTSFTIRSEYNKNIKKYPAIEIVNVLPANEAPAMKLFRFSKTGTRELFMDVFYPPPAINNKIAVIILFGGGWRSGNRMLHHPLAQRLALLGYTCFTPDYRLSTEELFPAAIHDIKAAIRWVRKNAKKFSIDPAMISIAGHSAGGEIAAFMGSTGDMKEFEGKLKPKHTSSRVNAVVDMDGTLAFIHPESGEGDDSKKTSASTYWFGYTKEENPSLWKLAAPLTHAGPSSSPIFFINSSVARMHAGRDDYIQVISRYGIYTEIKTFNDAPHSFCFFEPWFTPMLSAIDGFLKKVFKPAN